MPSLAVGLKQRVPIRAGAALALVASMAVPATARARQAPFSAEGVTVAAPTALREPPVLRNGSPVPGVVEVTLTAAPARLPLAPDGPPVDTYAYNGSVPGPTLELHEGDSVVIHFRNRLPESTTVHWHGLHLPAAADGSPLVPIAPGTDHDYVFRVPRGTAGTYWYHPHPDMRTTYQVGMGLFGAIIIRAPDDPLEALGIPEKLLILSDNRFAADGTVAFPDSTSLQAGIDLENGREGDVLFVNGQALPAVTLRPGEVERWRIVNASAARIYRLALDGQPLIHVGSDGGLIGKPVEANDILLANSGRVEVLVRGGVPGTSTVLEDLPYDRYTPQTRPADWNRTRPLLRIETTDGPAAPEVTIPATLRPVAWLDTTRVAARRVVVMSQGLIDGRRMDLHRDDLHARLGTSEIWTVQNVVAMDHPFHLHGFRFQVLDRDGVKEPFASWKDTVDVPGHSSVRIVVRFDDYPGRWMYHCHILDHEDAGMMGILDLR